MHAGGSIAGGGDPGDLPSAECQSHLLQDPSAPCPDPSINLPAAQLIVSHHSSRYDGPLTHCENLVAAGAGFHFRFRVDDITEGEYDIFDAVYLNGANLDVDPPCGHAMDLAGFGLTHNIAVGDVLWVAQRITQGQKDFEVRSTYTIESEHGELLAAIATKAAPGFVDADLFQGLELLYGSNDICVRIPDVYALGALGLRVPGEEVGCLVDSHTKVDCCELWGHEYTVSAEAVIIGEYRYAPVENAPFTTFSLYRNDFIQLCTGEAAEEQMQCKVHASSER